MLSLVVRERRGGQFVSLREACISSLSLLRSLKPFANFGVVVVVLKPILAIRPIGLGQVKADRYPFIMSFVSKSELSYQNNLKLPTHSVSD